MTLPAVILVGGQGTRLRPLTERIRKDMLPLVDRPLLAYSFEHLRRHGVRPASRGLAHNRSDAEGQHLPMRLQQAAHA